jgi:hypothetical protein
MKAKFSVLGLTLFLLPIQSWAQNTAGTTQAFGNNIQSSGIEGKFRYYVSETYLNPSVFTAPAFRRSCNIYTVSINCNHLLQLHMNGQKAPLGPQGRVPGSLIRFMGSILRTATMTCDLPAHRRRSALQTFGDIANRRTRSHSSRDLFSLRQGKGEQPTPTKRRNNPTVMRQQTVNGRMRPVKGPAQSCATTLPLSSAATHQSAAPRKVPRISLASLTPPRREDLYQMVLHRPVESTRQTGQVQS